MGDSVPLVDLIILVAGITLILLTSIRVSRRRSVSRSLQGQTGPRSASWSASGSSAPRSS